MKYFCPKCQRSSNDGNLWCQEKFCPAENAYQLYEEGEWLGSFEIIKLLAVLPSAAIYNAQRDGKNVMLKIAHEGCQEKLLYESRLLQEHFSGKKNHSMFPVLLPAHPQTTVESHPFGKMVVKDTPRYFIVFENVEGVTLTSLLQRNPQPWYLHTGWLCLSIAEAIAALHQVKRLHLCLNPDIILVRNDRAGIPRPFLLDLGLASEPKELRKLWRNFFTHPAYIAPELLERGEFGPATDVYGLGMLLFEMLAGKPAHEYHLKRSQEINSSIQAGVLRPIGRSDLKNIPEIVAKAVRRNPSERQQSIIALTKELRANLPPVPREKKAFKIPWRSIFIVILSLLALSFLLSMAIFLPGVN